MSELPSKKQRDDISDPVMSMSLKEVAFITIFIDSNRLHSLNEKDSSLWILNTVLGMSYYIAN